MSETIFIRPKPSEGPLPRVVYLIDGTQLPAEGKRVVPDHHVRMLLRDGDVERFERPEKPKADEAPKTNARSKEQSK